MAVGGARCAFRRSRSVRDRRELGSDLAEYGIEVGVDQGHRTDPDQCDQRVEQAMLDQGRALIVPLRRTMAG